MTGATRRPARMGTSGTEDAVQQFHADNRQGHERCPCPTCGCCCIGRMGTCVGGCGPRGGRGTHDKAAERPPEHG